jgi:hypothetical protein
MGMCGNVHSFCSDIVKKERLACTILSQVMKLGCNTMNWQANIKAWSGNSCHFPGSKYSKVCHMSAK